MRDLKTTLILALKDYILLLDEELDSMTGLARVHGWESTPERIFRGEELRKVILDLHIKIREEGYIKQERKGELWKIKK